MDKKDQRRIFIFFLMLLCIISGTRDYMEYSLDEQIYEYIFDTVPLINDFNFATVNDIYIGGGYEVGYLFINSLMKTIGVSYYGFILLNAIFFYSCMYYGLKKYINDYFLFLFIFLYKIFVYNTLISMRQSITIAIFFIAVHYIKEQKPIKYFLCCMVACTFHNAALFLFPLYFINKFILTKNKFVAINIIFIPTLIFRFQDIEVISLLSGILNNIPFLEGNYRVGSLLSGAEDSGISIMHTLEYFFIMFVVYKFFEQLINFDYNSEFILKLFMILIIIFTMFSGYEIMTRIKDYLTFTYAIILGYICSIQSNKWRNIIKYIAIFTCTIGFFKLVLGFNEGFFFNYSSYILKNVSIFVNN